MRLIATDLDGTFLTDHHEVSAVNRAAVARAARAGIPTIYCTGRPLRWLDFLGDVGAHAHAIASNGAALVDLRTRRVERCWPMDDAALRAGIAAVHEAFPAATFALEWGDEFGCERIHHPEEADRFFVAPIAEQLDHRPDVLKLIVRHQGIPSDVFAPQVAALVGEQLSCTYSWVSAEGFAEVAAPGVSKAAALEVWACEHGFTAADTIAFGDMPNDLPLLRWSGRGFVMPTAHPELRTGEFEVVDGDQPTAVGRTIDRLLDAA